MIYLDYSATTKTDSRVLSYFNLASEKYFANANSLYKIGKKAKGAINRAGQQILRILNFDSHEIIFTSCATEANNLVIKGVIESFKGRKKRIITTMFEHSSIIGPINALQKNGYLVSVVRHNENGQVDLEDLQKLLSEDVALVSIGSVNSEIGIRQPIEEIAEIVHEAGSLLHCDATQSIGKEIINLNVVDYVTFSAHKFYGVKGIGALVKRYSAPLSSQINGGNSTTIYRSGTPATPLILSLKKALQLIYKNHDRKYQKVKTLNAFLRRRLTKIPNVIINSPVGGLPHILNFSIMGYSSRKMIKELSKFDIYVSNHSACASNTSKSQAILALTDDQKRASSSLRVSLSHLTTKLELRMFLASLKKVVG
ncbi:MAG: cysteine desulfurase family protein [Bacilli bacterium]|nr:cysteine desulfurase family protein [Bacilli bacterium]